MNVKPILQKLSSILPRLVSTPTAVVVVIIVAFILGYVIRGGAPEKAEPHEEHPPHVEKAEAEFWTCSMHPRVRQPKPGRCPICFMELVPIKKGDEEAGERALAISHAAAKLAEIQTSPVERKLVTVEVRMVGKVDYDESRLAYITAWVPGRLDRLYVDYTGVPVRKGEHLVYLYSPELYAAQEELLQALNVAEEMKKSDLPEMRETAMATVRAARDKLRLLGIKPEQIAQVERTKKATDHVTIHAPIGGIVIHKHAVEGMYVQTGSRIYTIADLSHLWVKLDAYEADLPWIHYGQEVEFETEAHPGRPFTGTIALVNPMLDERTRTVKVRLNADNRRGLLKPGMFVRAVLRAKVTADGRAIEPRLAGKWICSMHPEILKDEAGRCDICQMPLVTTESLGIAGPKDEPRPPLVIPASAPLITGQRAVVYVQAPAAERPTFEGKEVVLGPRAGDYYVVLKGLDEGELVVTRGNFKIDSELQLQAKKSMMSMPGGPVAGAPPPKPEPLERFETPEAFRQQLTAVLDAYLSIWRALAADDARAAAAAAKPLAEALAAVDMRLLKGKAHMAWMRDLRQLGQVAKQFASAKDIKTQREAFDLLSQALPSALKRFGHTSKKPIIELKCPMAFNNRGATWLQDAKEVRNPYFGAAMLTCGEATGRVEGRGSRVEGREKSDQ